VSMLAFFAWATPHIASACSCAGGQLPAEAARQADAVFEGRVVRAPTRRTGSYTQTTKYEFSVVRVWKGDLPQNVSIKTQASSAACGRRYTSGEVYLVYARRGDDNVLRDNLCSRTRKSRAASEDFASLGPGQSPIRTREKTPGQTALEPPRIPSPRPDLTGFSETGRGCHIGTAPPSPSWGLLMLVLAGLPSCRRSSM